MRRIFFVCLLAALVTLVAQSLLYALPYEIGDLLLAYGSDSVEEVNPQDGSSPQTLTVPAGKFSPGGTTVSGGGVAFDENLNLFVTVANYTGDNSGIIKFNANGEVAGSFDGGTDDTFRGLAVRDDVIYVATNNGIQTYNATTGASLDSFGGTYAYRGVAFDSAGNLYATRSTKVMKWTAGSFSGNGTDLEVTGLTDAYGLDFDATGNLYVANGSNRTVKKYAKSDSGFSTSPTTITVTGPGSGNQVIGLTFDPGIDVLYASHTDTSTNQIVKFSPTDTSTTAISNTSSLTNARHLAVNPTPEPAIIALFGVGLAIFGLAKRRRFLKNRAKRQSRQ